MPREVPFLDDEICDNCREMGAFDFMGDLLCSECAKMFISNELCNRCGLSSCECGLP